MLVAACYAFDLTSTETATEDLIPAESPFRGQQLWRSADDTSGDHRTFVQQAGLAGEHQEHPAPQLAESRAHSL